MVEMHIGLALYTMKKICQSQETCNRCPLYCFCCCENTFEVPEEWNEEMFPNLIVGVDIKQHK